jgi:hypothetical protein
MMAVAKCLAKGKESCSYLPSCNIHFHCVLVFYPFEVDCEITQDRQGWGRSAGPSASCSGQDIENHFRSDGVDVYCEDGLI